VLCLRLAAEQVTEKSAKGGTAPSNPPPDMFLKIHMQHQACYPLTDAKTNLSKCCETSEHLKSKEDMNHRRFQGLRDDLSRLPQP